LELEFEFILLEKNAFPKSSYKGISYNVTFDLTPYPHLLLLMKRLRRKNWPELLHSSLPHDSDKSSKSQKRPL
jgi:hypothetical protein